MGLISTVTGALTGAVGTVLGAGAGALGGVMADQWKEYFYCEAIPNDILVTKGEKRTGGRSVNKKGSDNIISNGSVIAVADGQCMIIVEQGKIVEVCAEPGEFIYDTSTEPSIFAGSLGSSILATFQAIGRRFTFGGDTGKDQRVYYFNTKEILDNKFGTNNPIDFRVVDSKVGFDMDVALRINGSYTFKIVNPLLFYANVCGNVEAAYNKSNLTNQMRTEFVDALAPALSRVSDLEIRPSKLPQYTKDLKDAINIELAKTWTETRGIAVENIAMNPPTLTEEDKQKLQNAQEAAVYSNPL
ncbi:MAG: SPFH domain-containing protein, partial [Lachnospiraceae bacterium]|nr:SPFH domain-containing protein [Lachnospiraceae bacterium]